MQSKNLSTMLANINNFLDNFIKSICNSLEIFNSYTILLLIEIDTQTQYLEKIQLNWNNSLMRASQLSDEQNRAHLQGGSTESLASLLAISESSHQLFCIHPLGGQIDCYRKFAELIKQQFAVYGIQSIGLYDENEPLTNIETMAKEYNKVLTKLNPKGPHYILGWSMGGYIAFEMAHQLALVDKKPQLIIVDTPATTEKHDFEFVFMQFISQLSRSLFKFTNPDVIGKNYLENFTMLLQTHNFIVSYLLKLFFKIKYHNKMINLTQLSHYLELMKQDFITRGTSLFPLDDILQHLKTKNLLLPQFDDISLKRFYEVLRANVYAMCNYTLKNYNEEITFIRSKTKFKNLPNSGLGWQRYCSNVNIINIPCDHFTIFHNEIALDTLKNTMQQIISKAEK